MIKNDKWIKKQAEQGMIVPFLPRLISKNHVGNGLISFGLSSFGYDIRLSPQEFWVFHHVPGEVINPKKINPNFLEKVKLHRDRYGDYFILPAHSYGLGVAFEALNVPDNITVQCLGKSTYARVGVIVNVTPAEAGWQGHLTLEMSNSSSADCRIYANEGIVQLLFLEGKPCETSYADRQGKYQNQPEKVVFAKV